MATPIVTTRGGDTRHVAASDGMSVMEAIREAGMEALLALFGGSASCATYHGHVDAADLARLPPMQADEDDLLHSSDHRTPLSRLRCQVPATDGLRVTIAPKD